MWNSEVSTRPSLCHTPISEFKEDDVLLVYAGRLAPEKNLSFLLQSFAGVARALNRVHLLIVGGGQKQFEEVPPRAAELNLNSRIRFTGMISYEKLPSYLAMCDAFVAASVTEVHPLSVIEGMAAGLSVVGINSSGVGDTVEDGKTGFLATQDLASFTAKLTRLCLDASLRKQMSEAARQGSSLCHRADNKIHAGTIRTVGACARTTSRNWEVRLRGLLEKYLQ